MVTGHGPVGTVPCQYNNGASDNKRGTQYLIKLLVVIWSNFIILSTGPKTNRCPDNLGPSLDCTEEIVEWKPSNGEGCHNKKDFNDNLQVFVGNILHTTTEDDLKVCVN